MLMRAKIIKEKQPEWRIHPDFIAASVRDIDFHFLRELGVTTCLVDLDGTVVERDTYEVDPILAQTLARSGLDVHIATNRPLSRDLKNLKSDLGAKSVIHPKGLRGKPTIQYYHTALQGLEREPQQVVMIGDRYIQDILGANRAGIYSLLVYKLGPSKGRADRWFSSFEQYLTNISSRKYYEVTKVK
jgi:HAD superfamily phosphatase (TIGR01668 family)